MCSKELLKHCSASSGAIKILHASEVLLLLLSIALLLFNSLTYPPTPVGRRSVVPGVGGVGDDFSHTDLRIDVMFASFQSLGRIECFNEALKHQFIIT